MEQLAGFSLAALGLPPFEVANATWKKALRTPSDAPKILAALELALSMDIQWVKVDYRAIAELPIAERITAYDASYLWVTREIGALLVTLDKRLLLLAGRAGS